MIRQPRLRPARALGFALGLGLIVAPSAAHAAKLSATYALSAEEQEELLRLLRKVDRSLGVNPDNA